MPGLSVLLFATGNVVLKPQLFIAQSPFCPLQQPWRKLCIRFFGCFLYHSVFIGKQNDLNGVSFRGFANAAASRHSVGNRRGR